MKKSRLWFPFKTIFIKAWVLWFLLQVLIVLLLLNTSEARNDPSPRQLHFIKDITYTKNSSSAKIVISFDGPVTYKIIKQYSRGNTRTVILRVENCVINPRIERLRPDKKFVTSISIRSDHTVRSGSSIIISISLPEDVSFNLAENNSPFSIVANLTKISATPGNSPYPSASEDKIAPAKDTKRPTPSISPQELTPGEEVKNRPVIPEGRSPLHLIVIDPGHGGHDKGATGCNGVYEKDLTLMLAKSLKKIIEENMPQVKVELTRNRDEYLSLEKRVKIANTMKADLFISLHFNAHENPAVRGIETYFLNVSQDKEAARVAAIENAVLKKKLTDLEAIIQDLLKASSIAESSRLARTVHEHIVESLKTLSPDIRDLGVKSAPFYVLFGTNMPSILIEAGFISNRDELDMIKSREFSQAIANGIVEGVKMYAAHADSRYYLIKAGTAEGAGNKRVTEAYPPGP